MQITDVINPIAIDQICATGDWQAVKNYMRNCGWTLKGEQRTTQYANDKDKRHFNRKALFWKMARAEDWAGSFFYVIELQENGAIEQGWEAVEDEFSPFKRRLMQF